MSTTTRLVTADELLVTPHRDERGNDCLLELIRGVLKRRPLFNVRRGLTCARLAASMGMFASDTGLGVVFPARTGFRVESSPDTVLCPCVSFVSKWRLAAVSNLDDFIPFAPDLAVEMPDPEAARDEIDLRVGLYFGAGAGAVWVIDVKKRAATVYASPTIKLDVREPDSLWAGNAFPGFCYTGKLFDFKIE